MNYDGKPEAHARLCSATTKAGRRCQGRSFSNSGLCYVHDPKHREAVEAGRLKGGLTYQAKLRRADLSGVDLSSAKGISVALERVAYALLMGSLKESEAKTIVTVLKSLAEVRDLRAIEEKLDAEDS